MCRFVVYQGPPIPIADLVTRPAHSIIHQSFKAEEREEPLNGDGFGIAWYAPAFSPEPAVFREITPAWNDENLIHLARVTASSTILAHVRAATQGLSVIKTNCHPFSAGPYAFMHNGNVSGFWQLRRKILNMLSDRAFSAIRGTTDSEHMFALFLDRLAEQDAARPLDAMAGALTAVVGQIAELVADQDDATTLNLAVTDGERTAVCRAVVGDPNRANTLYIREGRRYVCGDDGTSHMIDDDDDEVSVIVASEPLFDSDTWKPVPLNHVVLIAEDRSVTIRSC